MFTKLLRCLLKSTLILAVAASAAFGQQNSTAVRGRVADELNASIVGASVTITDANGQTKSTVSNPEGTYVFSGLAPGKY